jgi:hypothetical protein
MKYVHEECLKTWVVSRYADVIKSSCELCKTPFKMRLDIKLVCKLRGRRLDINRKIAFYIAMTILLAGLSASAWILADRVESSSGESRDGLIIGLVVNCFLLLVFFITTVCSIVDDSKCVHQFNTWHFLERPQQTNTVQTQPSQHLTYDSAVSSSDISALPSEPEILILPESVQVSGRLVQVPRLEPSLSRVAATGDVQAFVVLPSRSESLASSFSI